ncbi:zinc-binding alcohol dehydrogenase family protein [Streptacidiphilus sp. N1-12]|uniref:Zinc-binding alcohol dehydrogenase family protein n=2 Tax=Streptacidiphilus alkalitolerans TaxID=3342712 RepID=A0ABV6W7T2_9ACTN
MQAVHAIRFGDPTALELVTDLPDPTPGPGEVAIDVSHSAVGLIDLFFRQGRYQDRPGMPQPPFVPGLEVAGTVRALGDGVTGLSVGEQVVAMSSGSGTGGYASVYIAKAPLTVSIEGRGIDPALAVSVIPNAAMAHVALTQVAHLVAGGSVLVHGALGGLSAGFPGVAKQLGASRVVGTVLPGKLAAGRATKLPYDRIVDSTDLHRALGDEKFDVVIDPVGGTLRTSSFDVMAPGSRLIAAGNASDDWGHQVDTNQLWFRSITVSGYNAGAFLPTHPEFVPAALAAAIEATAAGLAETDVDVLPFSQAVTAHRRMESRDVKGRIVLTPEA